MKDFFWLTKKKANILSFNNKYLITLLLNGLACLPLIIYELNGIGIFICKKICKRKSIKKNINISIFKLN